MQRFSFTIALAGIALAAPAWADIPPAAGTTVLAQAPRTTPDARSLLGRSVQNPQGTTIGRITSVHLAPDGEIAHVIVGIGEFLGLGEREVALPWKGLSTTDGNRQIIVNAPERSLRAMPEYRYSDPSFRGTIFLDPQPEAGG